MKYNSTKQNQSTIITDRYLDDFIGIQLLEENKKAQEGRNSSGKLAAGRLSWPLQWQILYKLGVPLKEIDEYTIRKFLRGKHCEEWFISKIPGVIAQQTFREYKNVIGYEDCQVNTENWNNPIGVIPVEIKSTANAKFKRILDQGADRAHILQTCLYALASDKPQFAIAYIAADDYRVKVFIYQTQDFKNDVDMIIDRYEKQGVVVPVFQPEEDWQGNPKYSSYPDWMDLNEDQIKQKLVEFQNGKEKQKTSK